MPPMPLTILMLVECFPYMPPMLLTILTLALPSRHASNAAYHSYTRSAPLTPPHTGLILKAAYDPCAPQAPHFRPHHPHHFPSLRSHGALKICLQRNPQPPLCLILSPPLTILMLRY
ncbi:hypothetical protein O181_067935 [Austropuccinia psidii MF-1]|uniref:Uncharacterized protein n=1 Tax=Austropuccinia psidii MF-1 TaxID=1389203 RepID=A0A9Q3I6L5_9BASI|nr:hypothetical protein [Austropuccinia psidii MF-1]